MNKYTVRHTLLLTGGRGFAGKPRFFTIEANNKLEAMDNVVKLLQKTKRPNYLIYSSNQYGDRAVSSKKTHEGNTSFFNVL